MGRSLRAQLLSWVLAPLLLLAGLNAAASWRSARDASNLVTDRMLAASARSIAEQARIEDGVVQVVVPPAALEMFDNGAGDYVYYAARDASGALLAGTADLPTWARRGGEPSAAELPFRDAALRLLAYDHQLPGRGPPATVTVAVGTTLRSRDALLRHLWLTGSGQQLAMVVAAGLFMAYGLKRGLEPLLRLRDAVLGRPDTSLEPLQPGAVQAELQPLVSALNAQIARVSRQLAAQRRFVANAAHQLRTPLTLLSLQATYARRHPAEQEAVLAEIQASAQRLSRLAGQLLTLSRAEPGSRRARGDRVDLGVLARGVLSDFAEPALAKGIDISLEDPGSAFVSGDATMLGEMLVNLVDNALAYCPAGSAVTVEVGRQADAASLIVRDDGPGLPPCEWDRAFERFYRPPGSQGHGSGLGLAIVQEVAASMGGSVSLKAAVPSGLRVEVRLPAAAGGADAGVDG